MIELLKNSWHGHTQDSEFCGPDSRELYQANLRRLSESWPWRHQKVRYSLNSQGYRAAEFDTIDWSSSVLMFGCSYVFGCGIDDSQTMAAQLSQRLGRPVINLGAGATDDMFQWINSNRLYSAGVRPWAVIYVWPGVNRLTELRENLATWNWGVWNCHSANISQHWVTNETHVWQYLDYLSMSVRNMWQCPVLEYYAYMNRPDSRGTIQAWAPVRDQARDLLPSGTYHPGPETNRYWVDELLLPAVSKI